MAEAEMVTWSGEAGERESRSDDEEYSTYFEEERRGVALSGPVDRVAISAEDI